MSAHLYHTVEPASSGFLTSGRRRTLITPLDPSPSVFQVWRPAYLITPLLVSTLLWSAGPISDELISCDDHRIHNDISNWTDNCAVCVIIHFVEPYPSTIEAMVSEQPSLFGPDDLHFFDPCLTPINSGSFRSRVESLKTSIAELLHLLTDVFIHSEALFGRDVKDVVQQPIDKGVENFLAKLKSWQYWLDSHGRPRSLEDIITVCSASGQLVFGIQEFKTMVTESSLSPNIKPVLKWNRGVCDLVLRTAVEKVVQKMKTKIEEIKSTVPTEPRMINLPSFSTSPHEYITTTGQELLQLFHLWEQFFLDDNVVYSFFIALKKKFEGDHSSFS
ncbi:hypothetical protein Y032_0005g2332 [Ancylostoma ceylanicum]|uniref:Uncharacterized protein n=1 Tax=Ancylostoma ceylanicum TaxID=53326 RepID=A0A016VR72_9BILA|nr:hypothetical protein Y032_0005g2332 [Ancylostoma ceylanicum]